MIKYLDNNNSCSKFALYKIIKVGSHYKRKNKMKNNTEEKSKGANKINEYVLTASKNENFILQNKNTVLNEPRLVVDFVRQFYGDDIVIYESAFILLLDIGLRPIGWAKISQGGMNSTIVDIKIVAKYIADTMADSFIFVHNHPSGRTEPSNADIKLTENLCKMGELLTSNLLDSIILTQDSYRSFADNNDCTCLINRRTEYTV